MKYFLKILVLTAGALAVVCPSMAQTVAAARTIRSKTQILTTDIVLLEGTMPGTFQQPDQVVGKEARVILYPGRPIRVSDIGPPAIIERNQIVKIRFSKGALMISVDGRALARGGLGDRIRAMNLTSRTTVTGIIIGPMLIEVAP